MGTTRGRSKSGSGGSGGVDEKMSANKPSNSATAEGGTTIPKGEEEDGGELGKACQEVVEIATEKLVGNIAQMTKKDLFSLNTNRG